MRFFPTKTTFLLALAVALGGAGFSWAAVPASAVTTDQSLRSAAQLTAQEYGGPANLDIALPAGAEPTRLQGTLEPSGPAVQVATVGVAERVAATDLAAPTAIDVPLTAEDLDGSNLRVWLTAGPDDQGRCEQWQQFVTLSEIVITYSDPESSESVAAYLAGTPDRFTVVVEGGSDEPTQQAALNAATTAARLFPSTTAVSLATIAPSEPSMTNRVLALRATEGPSQLALTPAGLTLTGDSSGFDEAVRALGGPYRELLSEPAASQLTAYGLTANGETLTLSALGVDALSISALGDVRRSVTISQSAFPRPSDTYTVELLGAITAVAGGTGRVNLLWEGQLLESIPMTDVTDFAASLTIDPTLMRREGTLTVEVQYLPASGTCAVGQLPARLDIDVERSTVIAQAGQAMTGFEMFPQSLESTTAVAWGAEPDAALSMVQAGALLVGLQRISDSPVVIDLMSWSSFVAAEIPGVAIGLSEDEASQVNTPLRLAPFRTIDADQQRFSAEVNGSFAALQAYRDGERPLLTLGGVGAEARTAEQAILDSMAADTAGFATFTGDVAAAQPGQTPFDFELGVLASQPEQVASRGPMQLWWLWIALAGLAGALVLGYLIRRRS